MKNVFLFTPIENVKNFMTFDITQPKEGLVVLKDRYWLCLDGDLTKALFFVSGKIVTGQCNKDKRVHEHVLKNNERYKKIGNVQIVFSEVSYIPQED